MASLPLASKTAAAAACSSSSKRRYLRKSGSMWAMAGPPTTARRTAGRVAYLYTPSCSLRPWRLGVVRLTCETDAGAAGGWISTKKKNATTPNTASSWANGCTCEAGVEDTNPRHQATHRIPRPSSHPKLAYSNLSRSTFSSKSVDLRRENFGPSCNYWSNQSLSTEKEGAWEKNRCPFKLKSSNTSKCPNRVVDKLKNTWFFHPFGTKCVWPTRSSSL